MKSGGPWNLRGLRPEARAAAREAARRSGMSVGEWLNAVIQPIEEEDADWWTASERPLEDEWQARPRYAEREREYRNHDEHAPPRRRRERESHYRSRQSSRYEDWEGAQQRDADWRRRDHEPDDRYHPNFRDDDWERDRRREASRGRERAAEDDERPARRERDRHREQRPNRGGPYRAEHEIADRPRREQQRFDEETAVRAQDTRDSAIDNAVAEIEARQRALDGDATAEITTRQRAPDGDAVPERSFGEREAQPLPSRPQQSGPPASAAIDSHAAQFDLSGLERQLRQITTKIEALRPNGELGTAISGLHAELAAIARSLTDALPRRALESLEIEIKALGERIDHSRQSGVDATALSGIERGLTEVRQALGGLTPAESLIGFDEAVKALAKKVDAIVARDDPATLQQLETAIGALRGIVSHVASNDTLTKVAEDVRALAAKVDGLAANAPALSALEIRIDKLAGAISASTEAGHSVPRELEKLLSGLIEKLEWVQLTHTDHSALAHLEDRIATLVKRLDTSDARLGLLEGVERGLADLLVYIEQLRTAGTAPEAAVKPIAVDVIEQEVAEIRETERRTQDSLEDMQGTVEHVVDRLATIESGMRGDRTKPPAGEPSQAPMQAPQAPTPPAQPEQTEEPASEILMPAESGAVNTALKLKTERAPAKPAMARKPIDPSLPPDHPLEPGSAAGRSRQQPSAAERIAASEAAVGTKPPVIPDPGGGKADFIAAARRAAKAAAAAPVGKSSDKPGAGLPQQSKKLTERLRTIVVAGAVVAIVVGGFHIISRMFADGGANAPQTQSEPPRVLQEPLHLPSEPSPAPEQPPRVETEPPPAEKPGAQTEAPAPASTAPALNSAPSPATKSEADPLQNATPDPAPGANPKQQSDNTRTASDITGSLPSGASTVPNADKLPPAIGGPALRAAALAGDASAAYEVATRFAEGRVVPPNNEEAARWFDIAAKKGLAPAQFRLGMLYEKGLGVKKNLGAARELYRAAAEKGHGKAMHNLAVLYAEGADGKPDYRTAVQWFRKAADHGITDSQYNLAVLYARGVGVEQNFTESYKWFLLAARDGDQDAAQKRDEMAARLDQKALEAARAAAEKWTALPEPADAVTVKGTWDAPANGAHAAKPKARAAKAPQSIVPE